jgi:small-conductance mechanosensitive channel
LAAVKQAEEEKKEGGLISYLAPVVQGISEGIANLGHGLKKLFSVFHSLVAYFSMEKNRQDVWAALLWLSLFGSMGALLERGMRWCLRRYWKVRATKLALLSDREQKERACAVSLFTPFLLLPFLLPFFITFIKSLSVTYWFMGLWIILYSLRAFLLDRSLRLPLPAEGTAPSGLELQERGLFSIFLVGGLGILLTLSYVLDIFLDMHHFQKDYRVNIALFFSLPLFVLYLREWQSKKMPGYLAESSQLITTPQILTSPVNICIRYFPWAFLVLGTIFMVSGAFLNAPFAQSGSLGCILSFGILLLFLRGRRALNNLGNVQKVIANRTLQPPRSPVLMPLLSLYLPQVARILQWGWHISFFAAFMMIWSQYVSGFLLALLSHPLIKTLINLGVIWGIMGLVWLGINFFVHHHTHPHLVKGKRIQPTAFAKTFGPMLHSIFRWVMVLTGFFMSLDVLGFDLKPLVYLMSAFAFAISLGAQSLVKDVINGFFTLIDGNIIVGDVVTIGNHSGTVESLSIRAIFLRHSTGALQRIPFSEISSIINNSRDYAVLPIDVAISYRTDIGHIYDALKRAGEEMVNDAAFSKMVLEPLTISGIDKFTDNAVHVMANFKIKPEFRDTFTREFNRRLKIHMDAANIQPPITFSEQWALPKTPQLGSVK